MEPHSFRRALERAKGRLMGKAEPEAELPKEEVKPPLEGIEEAVPPELAVEVGEVLPPEEIEEAVPPEANEVRLKRLLEYEPEERVPPVKRIAGGLWERWSNFAMGFGIKFLEFWNKRRIIFPTLFLVIAALLAWYWFYPSLISLVLTLTVGFLTVILGLTGLAVVPTATKDPTKTVKLVTASLGTVIPVTVILLAFMAWMIWPAIFLAPVPAEVGPREIDVHADQVRLYGYSVKGPVDYNGTKTTHIHAKQIELWGLRQVSGKGEVVTPYSKMNDFDIYCTYIRGTGEALRVSSATAWRGEDSPPFLVSLLGDPATMTDVTLRVVFQSAGETTLGRMEIVHEFSVEPENSFPIRAGRMSFKSTSSVFELLQGRIKAKDLSMENLVLEVPQDNTTTIITADLIGCPYAEMRLTLLELMGVAIEHFSDLIPLLLGRTVTWENVKIIAESMRAENLASTGLGMEVVYA